MRLTPIAVTLECFLWKCRRGPGTRVFIIYNVAQHLIILPSTCVQHMNINIKMDIFFQKGKMRWTLRLLLCLLWSVADAINPTSSVRRYVYSYEFLGENFSKNNLVLFHLCPCKHTLTTIHIRISSGARKGPSSISWWIQVSLSGGNQYLELALLHLIILVWSDISHSIYEDKYMYG